jgi:hypothetical protein
VSFHVPRVSLAVSNNEHSVAVVMAAVSLVRKLWVDKTLRLKRQGKHE